MQGEVLCEICGVKKTFTRCPGCERLVCDACVRFELFGWGCGCVWPVYFCPDCALNPQINPNAPFRDRE